jgi:Flp pilus assembly protein TadD
MMIRIPSFIFALLVLILTGCVSTSGPVTIRDSSVNSSTNSSTTVSTAPETQQQNDNLILKSEQKESVALAQPVSPNQRQTSIPLLDKLVEQANSAFNQQNYQQSINVAERGLRINRKDPRFYLALSKAYKALANKAQSVHFARQGLRYVASESPVKIELQNLTR